MVTRIAASALRQLAERWRPGSSAGSISAELKGKWTFTGPHSRSACLSAAFDTGPADEADDEDDDDVAGVSCFASGFVSGLCAQAAKNRIGKNLRMTPPLLRPKPSAN